MTVHGDDFACTGTEADLCWLKQSMAKTFEITSKVLGPAKHHSQEVKILNRVIRWEE